MILVCDSVRCVADVHCTLRGNKQTEEESCEQLLIFNACYCLFVASPQTE